MLAAIRDGDYLDACMLFDKLQEEGSGMWDELREGEYVLVEMPQRWYCGRVQNRYDATSKLFPVVVGHHLGDLGGFLKGTLSQSAEVSPSIRAIEVSHLKIESVYSYDKEAFEKINKRTHPEEQPRASR